MWREFQAFLVTQNVLALAIAVIIGTAIGRVVTALVEDIVMPLAELFVPHGTWRQLVVPVGDAELRVGQFLGAVVDLLIVGFVVWQMSRRLIETPPPGAKPATRPCPFCRQAIDAAAVRCAYCTSEIPATA